VRSALLAEAQRRFEAEDDCWYDNRDANELFIDELEQTLARLGESDRVIVE
jgi:hypothetical protein